MTSALLYVTQLVYLHPGKEDVFHAFEDTVLPLLKKYDGELLLRLRPSRESFIAGSLDGPYEVHLIRFPNEASLAAYARDEERERVLSLKNEAVRATLLVKGSEA
jgi:antibiotic biosynthesis monooxygenase (ABM) superfamily enzyme